MIENSDFRGAATRNELVNEYASSIYRIRELGTALDIVWQAIEMEEDPVKFETGVCSAAFLANEIAGLAGNIEGDLRPIANRRYGAVKDDTNASI